MKIAASSSTKARATATALMAGLLAGATFCFAAPRGISPVGRTMTAPRNFGGGQPYYGGYAGFYSPFIGIPSYSSGYSQPPNYWWTGAYPSGDPRGEAYNPSAGYAWDSVTTLLLETIPAKARVTLDGVFVGTADRLGPFQLPAGEHTLRIEAAGYEPSETVLNADKPVVQQLQVRLSEVDHNGKPAPRQ